MEALTVGDIKRARSWPMVIEVNPLNAVHIKTLSEACRRAILGNQKRRKNQNREFRLRGDDC